MMIIAFFEGEFSVIIKVMKIFAKVLMIVLLIIPSPLFCEDVVHYVQHEFSPFSNPSYFGRLSDSYSNPAALALAEDDGSLRVSFSISDNYDTNVFFEPVGYIQNQVQEFGVALFNKNISLTIKMGSSLTDRRMQDMSKYPLFDIYSNMDLELVASYALPYFSVGAVLKGGNSMVRMDKEISGIASALANSYLSPFERVTGSERFSLGFGAIGYFDNFSFGILANDFVSIFDGELHADFISVMEKVALSFSIFKDKFSPTGELSLIRPRVSLYYGEFNDDTSTGTFMADADFEFQFLPDVSFAIGVGYRELDHELFKIDKDNGHLSLYLRGEVSSISFDAGLIWDTATFNSLSPQISISYIR